jgi:hypothetical protein
VIVALLVAALTNPFASKASTCHRCQVVRPYNAKLNRMAQCESSNRWYIATGNGYYGGLQFDMQTWRSVGGRGYPNQNSILEQKYRAVLLIRRRGYAPWPRCGYV